MTTTKPTRKALETEINHLTLQQKLALSLASRVWEYIGHDVMQAVAESGIEAYLDPRAEVVEVVLDADRYRDEIDREIRRAEKDGHLNRLERDLRLAALLRLRMWFAISPLGASYAAQCALIGRAFGARES